MGVLERDPEALVGALTGRILSADQVLARVRRWLGGLITRETRYRVLDPRAARRDRPVAEIVAHSTAGRRMVAAVGTQGALSMALIAHWARCHRVPEREALAAAGLPCAGRAVSARLALLGKELLVQAPVGSAGELVGAALSEGTQAVLLGLIGAHSGPGDVLRALSRESVFPALARQLAVMVLRALAAGAQITPRAGPPQGRPGEPAGVARLREFALEATSLNESVTAFARAGGDRPTTAPGWEARFASFLGWPLRAARLESRAEELALEAELAATGLIRAVTYRLAAEASAFAGAYRALVPSIWLPCAGPLWPHRVRGTVLLRLERELKPPMTVLVVVDAMRHDLFSLLEVQYLASPRSGLRLIEQRVMWALAPTVTRVNLRALLEGAVLRHGRATDGGEALLGEPGFTEREGFRVEVIRVVDEHVHGSALSLGRLADTVIPAVIERLASLVEVSPRGAVFAITADHGFTQAPDWRPHAPSRRWRHGGLDPFEVLVPFAVYRKAS